MHTDTACLTNGPDRYYRDERGRVGRYTFTGYREVHAVMSAHGDGAKPIWMTELGWSTQSTRPRSCSAGEVGGDEAARRVEQAAGALPARRVPLPGRRPVRRVGLWFGMQDTPGAAPRARLRPVRRAAARSRRRRRSSDWRAGSGRGGCGGYIDRTPPTIRVLEPVNGQRFAGKLSVRVRAHDNRGGTGLERIYMSRNGRHVLTWGGNGGSIDPWWASADWRPGTHTLTFRVRDNAHNETP